MTTSAGLMSLAFALILAMALVNGTMWLVALMAMLFIIAMVVFIYGVFKL